MNSNRTEGQSEVSIEFADYTTSRDVLLQTPVERANPFYACAAQVTRNADTLLPSIGDKPNYEKINAAN